MHTIKSTNNIGNHLLYIFIFFSWIGLFFSINVGPDAIKSFVKFIPTYKYVDLYSETYLFNLYLNFFRAITPGIILILSFLIFFLRFKKIEFQNINLAILIYFIYALIQFIALYLSEFDRSYYFWVVSLLSTVFLLINASHYKTEKLYLLFYISVLILVFVYTYFFLIELNSFWYSHHHIYGSFNYDTGIKIGEFIYINPTPRTSGLSRSALIIFILCSVIFFNKPNNFFTPIWIFIMIITSTSIFLFQSRTLIVCLIVSCLIIAFLFSHNNFKRKILLSILLIAFPLFLAGIITVMRPGLDEISKEDSENFFKKFQSRLNLRSTYFVREIDPLSFSSKRTIYWKKLFNESKNNLLLGFGPQADRHFLDSRSASSTIFYSLICAGLPGVILMLLLYLLTLKELITFWKNTNLNKNDFIIEKACFVTLVIICMRSVLETNHAVFSIDFLFFILCFSIINKKNNYVPKRTL